MMLGKRQLGLDTELSFEREAIVEFKDCYDTQLRIAATVSPCLHSQRLIPSGSRVQPTLILYTMAYTDG